MIRVLLPFLFVLFLIVGDAQARTETIAVVVNEDAVTLSDVNDRILLIIRSSGLQDTQKIRDDIRPQVLSALIEEQIKIQEAQRLELEVTQGEIDQGFAQIAGQNKMSADQFMGVLKRSNINIETLYHQIRSQISWTKIVSNELHPQVNIRAGDIDDALERMRGNIGSVEYQLAEIVLSVEDPKQESKVRDLARRLSTDIRAGKAPFFQVAQQFSKSAGAARGGDLGWVEKEQLVPQISNTLMKMELNTVSAPVKTLTGYHILFLRGKREITEDNMPSKDQVAHDLGMERLTRIQKQYLLDLKAAAFIDVRV